MHEPPRLLDGELRPVEDAILRSAKEDAPSEAARAAAKAALGLEAPPPAPPATGRGWTLGAAGAVAAAGIAWMAVSMLSMEPPAPPPAPAVEVPAVEAPPPPPVSLFAPMAADDFVGPPTLPPAPAPKRTVAAKKVVRRPATSGGDSLAEELRYLDTAREALGRGPEGALAVLDRYAQRFPRGTLRPEARVLRIKALIAAGRDRQARDELSRLRRTRPGHPALPELERRLGGR